MRGVVQRLGYSLLLKNTGDYIKVAVPKESSQVRRLQETWDVNSGGGVWEK